VLCNLFFLFTSLFLKIKGNDTFFTIGVLPCGFWV
jgi:hypothetical protein